MPDGVIVTAQMLNLVFQQCPDVNAFKKALRGSMHMEHGVAPVFVFLIYFYNSYGVFCSLLMFSSVFIWSPKWKEFS